MIGGILAAQSMISAAKTVATVKKLAQFDVAVTNFQTKYNSLPGDSLAFGSGSYVNHYLAGDGYIEDEDPFSGGQTFGTGNYWATNFSGDIGAFWYDLSLDGLKSDSGNVYQNGQAGAILTRSGPNANVPAIPLGKNTIAVAFTYLDGTSGDPVFEQKYLYKHFYQIMSSVTTAPTAGATTCLGATGDNSSKPQTGTRCVSLTPAEALSLDTKMDDGIPTSGKVLASMATGETHGLSARPSSYTDCAAANKYVTNVTAVTCSMAIMIGAQNGTAN